MPGDGDGDGNLTYPIPIFKVVQRYYVYNIDHVTHLRREHNIIGVLVGTLPQAPQQNVFLGLPVQLLAEEARLLVEQGIAYVVDDVHMHQSSLEKLSSDERRRFKLDLVTQGLELSKASIQQARTKRESALKRLPEDKRKAAKVSLEMRAETPEAEAEDASGSLFSATAAAATGSRTPAELQPYHITPTTSHPPLSIESRASPKDRTLPEYSVYPGDPLRFHAHFLARGFGWDEGIELLSLIGGGRLGTGVKKGYLIGGPIPEGHGSEAVPSAEEDNVRCFCIEWAGM